MSYRITLFYPRNITNLTLNSFPTNRKKEIRSLGSFKRIDKRARHHDKELRFNQFTQSTSHFENGYGRSNIN